MKYSQRNFKLKNNEEITIRLCVENDAENLIKTVKEYLLNSEYIPLLSEEFIPTIEQEKKWIKNFIENENSLLLIALKDDQIIGNIDLTGSQRQIMKHTGMIGMGIIKEWRNIGLGMIMINEIIEWSRKNSILEKLWLEVYEENKLGLSLYQKAGFEINGKQANFFKHNEKFFDKIIMSREVK